ncbi:MAG: ATP-binding protein [Acidobacteria bacterium]|nr:MAG: ATP-binding protein [Acidobacteriota bacterium]
MPKETSSPFTPGLPVPVEFFVGRIKEITRLRNKVKSAQDGRLQVEFLVGERGIGKSSLAAFVKYLAEREHRMIGLHTFLGGVTSLEEMVRRIFDRLLKESVEAPWYDKVKKFFGNHIRQVGLFGISVEFEAPARDLRRMVHDFAPALRNLVNHLKNEKKGILLVLDDINGLASSRDFANWLKSLIDEIATSRKPLPLCLLLVAIDERRQELIQLQPSLARVFNLVEIHPWSETETREFYQNAFSRVSIKVEKSALDLLTRFSGGLPVFAHEIGDAAFNIDTDNYIDSSDALAAVTTAADIIGRKHLEPQVFNAIRSERYRRILRKLAREPLNFEFKRGEVWKRLDRDERKVFDNFLRRMAQLGVLRRDPERGAGAYRFTNLLHFVYFGMEAERVREAGR